MKTYEKQKAVMEGLLEVMEERYGAGHGYAGAYGTLIALLTEEQMNELIETYNL